MTTFQMACSRGDVMKVDAENRDEAVTKMKSMMDESAIKAHMAEKHPGDPVMSVADCHAMIEKDMAAV